MKPLKSIAASLIICLFCFVTGYAAQVSLQWDASIPAPEGYRLYQRSQGGYYDLPVWTGTATTCTISNLADNTTYYFVVRAFQGADESGDSNEVQFPAPTPSPTEIPAPIITSLSVE